MTCAGCAAEIGPSLLACPQCRTLVHAERLKSLASDAAEARSRQDPSAEIAAWRTALGLLPPQSAQHKTVHARVQELSAMLLGSGSTSASASASGSAQTADGQPAPHGRRNLGTGGAVSAVGLLAWKFKAVVLLVLTKGKLLLLGLTNASTLLSIIPTLGVYWLAYGWSFAAGLIASIYVHEMGHVFALSRFGIAASAPMFIPGFGAVIRSREHLTNPREEARVGLAGPIWGLGAAAVAFALSGAASSRYWMAIGHVGAWINLFNLLPVWQLDGAHAFKALSRHQRWLMTAIIAATLLITHEGLLVLLAIMSGVQAFREDTFPEGDPSIAWQYAGLIVVLSGLSTLTKFAQ